MLFELKCPECGEPLTIHEYNVSCPHCPFRAVYGAKKTVSPLPDDTKSSGKEKSADDWDGLTRKEKKALKLLATHAGNVILIYATLRRISGNTTAAITHDPLFVKSEYQKLLQFYDRLAEKCKEMLEKEAIPEFEDFFGK